MTTSPDSSGWRRVCSTEPLNSGASSRKSTPWWAREIAPGSDDPGAAAGDRRHRRAVVRRDERRRAVELDDLTDLPGERADGVGLEGLLAAERRQHRDEPLGEHRLADPGWPGHQQVVPTRGRQLEGQPRLRLARRRRRGRARAAPAPAPTPGRAPVAAACRARRRRTSRRRRAGSAAPCTVTPSTSWASPTFSSGTTTCRAPGPRRREHRGQDAAHAPDPAVERQLAEVDDVAGERRRG